MDRDGRTDGRRESEREKGRGRESERERIKEGKGERVSETDVRFSNEALRDRRTGFLRAGRPQNFCRRPQISCSTTTHNPPPPRPATHTTNPPLLNRRVPLAGHPFVIPDRGRRDPTSPLTATVFRPARHHPSRWPGKCINV